MVRSKNVEILKQTKSAKIIKYTEGNIEIVEKTYSPEYSHYWDRESKHLKLVKGFSGQPKLVSENKKELSFKFIFEGDPLSKIIISTNDTHVEKIFRAMTDEIAYMSKVDKVPENIDYKDRFYFLNKILKENALKSNLMNDINAMFDKVDKRKILMRYDPELDNYIINKEGKVLVCDFAVMRYINPLYVPAFYIVHLDKYEQYKKLPIFKLLATQLLEKINIGKEIFVEDSKSFDITLRLCFLEVCSYLLNAYIEDKNRKLSERKNIDPNGQMENWVRNSIVKVIYEKVFI